jgi:hypothetical protein
MQNYHWESEGFANPDAASGFGLCKKEFSQLHSLSLRLRREIALSIWGA